MTMKPVRTQDLSELSLCLANIETLLYAINSIGASTMANDVEKVNQCDAIADIAKRYVDDAQAIIAKI